MKAFASMRPGRVIVIVVAALVAGLVTDWLRSERVVFAPKITTIGPAE